MRHTPGLFGFPVFNQRQLAVCVWVVGLFLTLLAGQVDAHVALDYPNGGETLEAGAVVQVVWHDSVNHGPADYVLWYSITGPDGPWIDIAGGIPRSESAQNTYDWVVPDTPSDQVRLWVEQNNFEDENYVDTSDSDLAIVRPAEVASVVLEAKRDAAIYEDGTGTRANGSGSYFFAGRAESQNGSAERRALLAFPIAASLPGGSTITSVVLELTMSRTISGEQTVSLHRLLEDWSEGPSDPTGQEGGGASAVPGDVTWIHREFEETLWATPGGSFVLTASATLQVASEGSYSLESTPELVGDVQHWLDDPSSNFGWLLLIDSSASGSAKRFNSRENTTESSRPKLTIGYEGGLEGPTANFTFAPAQPRPGDEVRFSDGSTGEPSSWQWDFGDGQTSQEQNPIHTFTAPGSQTVTLVVGNASGTDSTTRDVPVGSAVRRSSRRVSPGPPE